MRDRHHRAGVVLQEALQPVDALGVQVVGRLVQQQQIGSREQQATQRHAATLTARQLGDVGVVRWAAQRVHRDLHVALEAPGVCGLDLGFEVRLQRADLVEVRIGVAPHRGHFFVAGEQVANRRHAVHHVAEHVLARIELGLLFQQTDREPGGEAGLAGVAVIDPGHDPKQARLTAAVGADDADLGPGIEGERNVLEHRAVRGIEPGEFVTRIDEFGGHDEYKLVPRANYGAVVPWL